LYYSELIWPDATENAFDPLFITSIVRQESLFEGFVRSTAGARGLMQIVPPTGESIAEQMGWPPDYNAGDLYSPYISIRMGTYYLNANRRLLNDDIYAALAAYNGGPGNAGIWQDLAGGDPDLFLEIVRFGETRDYIRNIYTTYTIYRGLYSPMQ
jgi:soluble lytic murein transglycosylase